MKRKKNNPIKRIRRRHHRTMFCLGFIAGSAFGFNIRKIIDSVKEKLAKKKA